MRIVSARHPAACAAAVIFMLASGSATALAASIEVSVLGSPQKQPLGGLDVILANPGIGYTATMKTNEQGKARFALLAPGSGYQVTVPAAGEWAELQAKAIDLRTNADQTLTLVLASRVAPPEVVQVSGEGVARINTVNAEVSSTLAREDLEALPIEGRDLTRALYRLPNVTQATGFYPEAPNVSINGANSLFSNYMIDGMDNNENFLGGQKFAVPTGFSQDVTVLTNNYSSEFGRTANGIFNVTSRSGNNQLGGEVFYLMRPGPGMDASSPFAQHDLSGNEVKDGFGRDQFGFGLGGPIVKDRTFFFVDAEYTIDDKDNLLSSPALEVNDTVHGHNYFGYYSFKIDHHFNDRWQSSWRVNIGDVKIERQGGGLEGGVNFPSAANVQDRDSALIAWSNRWSKGNILAESNVQFSRFRWNYGRPENGAGPQTVVLDPSGQTAAVLGHPGFVFDDLEETFQLQQKFDIPVGNHLVRVGAELISSDFSLLGGGNENGNYTVQLTQSELDDVIALGKGADLDVEDIPATAQVLDYNVELQVKEFGKRQNITSLYGEDVWSITPALNLTSSLRWDYDNLSRGGADRGDYNNVAPRLAANWQIRPNMAVRGGAGMFYDKILYAIYSDALQQSTTSAGFRSQLQTLIDQGILPHDTDIDRVTFDGNVSADFTSGITYLQGPTSDQLQGERDNVISNDHRILNPEGYDNPYTVQYTLGWQHQVTPSILYYVDLVRNLSYNLVRLRDLNAPSPYPIDPGNVVVRSQAQADATRPVAIVPGGSRNIFVSETQGEARYWAANFTMGQVRRSLPISWQLSYTLSKLENNTDDINFRAMDSNQYEDEWGPSINDRRHVITGLFSWYPINGMTITVAPLIQSGQPINRTPDAALFGTADLNGDGASFGANYVGNSDRWPGEDRNSDRLPWSRTVDLGMAYKFNVHSNQAIEVRADILNLLNETNLSGYSNNATQSNQIQIGPSRSGITEKNSGPPRQFQFGIRYVF